MENKYYDFIVIYTILDEKLRNLFRDKVLVKNGMVELDQSTYGITSNNDTELSTFINKLQNEINKICFDYKVHFAEDDFVKVIFALYRTDYNIEKEKVRKLGIKEIDIDKGKN